MAMCSASLNWIHWLGFESDAPKVDRSGICKGLCPY